MEKLTKEIKKTAENLTDNEARFLVDTYYQIQEYRKRTYNQVRAVAQETDTAPADILSLFAKNFEIMEKDAKKSLRVYVESKPIGQWMLSICGIGEVIAAGLMAHIDITKVQTAGQIQAYAGLDPTREWKKGEKRPHNAKLKTLCWKMGESFVKVSNNDKDVYGQIYKQRKESEQAKNENGDYAGQAKEKLEKFKIGKKTEAYKYYIDGKLPPAHIQARAKRYAVKLFLSHLFEVWYELENGKKPPNPYPIDILNHAHKIEPPNKDVVGL